MNEGLYPRSRWATLASIRETSSSLISPLLDDVVEVSKHNDHRLSDINDETDVQHLLKSFGIKSTIPVRLNELQFQLFTDFVFTWRFYFDNTSTWERSFSLFHALAIGLLRIAAWDFEVRNMDTEELPITFSSLPQWKTPSTVEDTSRRDILVPPISDCVLQHQSNWHICGYKSKGFYIPRHEPRRVCSWDSHFRTAYRTF